MENCDSASESINSQILKIKKKMQNSTLTYILACISTQIHAIFKIKTPFPDTLKQDSTENIS